jgi:hypothetical protein
VKQQLLVSEVDTEPLNKLFGAALTETIKMLDLSETGELQPTNCFLRDLADSVHA